LGDTCFIRYLIHPAMKTMCGVEKEIDQISIEPNYNRTNEAKLTKSKVGHFLSVSRFGVEVARMRYIEQFWKM
jgi:hypothetical protein